jgi:hypothetical protein
MLESGTFSTEDMATDSDVSPQMEFVVQGMDVAT